jgi:hypothetical protein
LPLFRFRIKTLEKIGFQIKNPIVSASLFLPSSMDPRQKTWHSKNLTKLLE